MKKYFSLIIIAAFVLPLFAQQEKTHEVTSEVKALTEFHDVIYPIWHTGWPEKDIKLLKSLLPDVEKGYNEIINAELPGILREKKTKWDDGLKKFSACVDLYKTATAKNDSVGLLNAAEKLHSQYEALVRTIRPLMKEVDAFHQVLYMLYHYYTPKYELDNIKKAAADLRTKMEEFNKAPLPKKLESKKELFETTRVNLDIAVKKLADVVDKGDDKKAIETAVDGVHSKYQEIEKLFD